MTQQDPQQKARLSGVLLLDVVLGQDAARDTKLVGLVARELFDN